MLTVNGLPKRSCAGLSRRELLQVGGAGLLGLHLPGLLDAEEAQAPFAGAKAKSVIFMFLFGGPSQLETFYEAGGAARDSRAVQAHCLSHTGPSD